MPDELHSSDSDSSTAAFPGPAPAPTPAPAPVALARWCADQGWPVLPLAPGHKTPAANCEACRAPGHTFDDCSCSTAGRWCHGFRAATLDPERIGHWWSVNPRFGVGVACGPAELVVIDIDAHPGRQLPSRDRVLPGIDISDRVDLAGVRTGFHTLAVLAALAGRDSPAEDATTLRVRTPSGGMHVWYQVSDGRRWQCSTGSTTGRALAWQVDVRAHGGYIIAPGTTTRAGTYTAVGEARRPAPLPAWLAAELARTGHSPTPPPPAPRPVPPRARQAVVEAGGGRDRAGRLLAHCLAEVAACGAVAEGAGFTDKLNRAAFTVGGLVAGGHVPQEAAEEALLRTAELARPGQGRRAAQIIRNGMAAGARRPLHLNG
ncbi:bifunctional DNA primase/polymerase [Streptomyces sp. NPDC047130]|uniref:bifunctional DNA primase/polymerase n=1 Tax=Streptomyces sp. NPDC047130 TaxID=3155261 RepID=UPI0033C750D4